MRAVEAMTRVIELSAYTMGLHQSQRPENDPESDEYKNDEAAVAIVTAMLNTAIPIARFRIHCEFVETAKKSSGIGNFDFTVCATSVPSLKASVKHLRREEGDVYISLWEQHPDRAEMLVGYQGPTQSQNFRNWLSQLDAFEWALPTNMPN